MRRQLQTHIFIQDDLMPIENQRPRAGAEPQGCRKPAVPDKLFGTMRRGLRETFDVLLRGEIPTILNVPLRSGEDWTAFSLVERATTNRDYAPGHDAAALPAVPSADKT